MAHLNSVTSQENGILHIKQKCHYDNIVCRQVQTATSPAHAPVANWIPGKGDVRGLKSLTRAQHEVRPAQWLWVFISYIYPLQESFYLVDEYTRMLFNLRVFFDYLLQQAFYLVDQYMSFQFHFYMTMRVL
jgi:hypothetical protein